jgi:hypothetical protein
MAANGSSAGVSAGASPIPLAGENRAEKKGKPWAK